MPSERVRKMEIRANEAFDVYRELYYEGGVSSVYFWNLDDGFAGVVLLKKGMLMFSGYHTSMLTVASQWHPSPAGAKESGTRFTSSRPSTEHEPHITSLPARLSSIYQPLTRTLARWT